MDFYQRYAIRKVSPEIDEFELIIYFDNDLTEFSAEFGSVQNDNTNILTVARQIAREKFPNVKVTFVKCIVGGIALASIPLSPIITSAQTVDIKVEEKDSKDGNKNTYYQVSSGDTLWNLSVKFGTSVDNIRKANHLTSDVLKLNQRLIIPKAFHTVGPGDYLSVIAKKYGTTVDAIKLANNMTTDTTQLGQTLVIPMLFTTDSVPTVTANSASTDAKQSSQTQISTYTVVAGDTLSAIAKRSGITVDALKNSNNLTSDVIHIGQILNIPTVGSTSSNPVQATSTPIKNTNNGQTTYTVVPGDSLSVIAKRLGITVDVLKSTNNLTSDVIRIGQTLIIPDVGTTSPNSVATPSTPITYTIVAGDSLSLIAKRFNVTIDALRNANNLTSDLVKIGQTLTIPNGQTTNNSAVSSSAPDNSMAAVQKSLQVLGYYTVPTLTGNNDSPTTQAIKNFQSDYSLPITGTVDNTTNTAINHAIVKKALVNDSTNYLGVPYVWGGVTPSGFDCSGFVYYMFNQHGVNMSRNTSGGLYTQGTPVDRTKLQPGDLVFFAVNTPGTISHVGFYIGNNQFISATNSKGIATYPMDSSYWSKYYVGAKRVY